MSTATLTRPEAPATDERFRWAPLLVVLAGTFVTFLDFFIVNVALDSIARSCTQVPALSSSSSRGTR